MQKMNRRRPVRRVKRRRSMWPLYVPVIALAIAAIAWSIMWFRSSDVTQQTLQGWFDREALAGRIYSCANPQIGGFPFRIEVRCAPAAMEWRGSGQPTVFAGIAGLLVAAQVYQPSHLISEISGPFVLADAQGKPAYQADWKLLQSSVRGGPDMPDRVSVAMSEPRFERIIAGGNESLFTAQRAELQGRIVEGSAAGNPVIDLVLRLNHAVAPTLNPVTQKPFNADITFVLRGLKDFSPKPWPARFREMQAAGGRIDITHARAQQGETIALATGSLSITDSGHLEGQLLLTVAGLDRLLPVFGLDRLIAQDSRVDRLAGQLDRLIPGLGGAARDNAATIAAGIGLLGEQTQLEGRRAVVLPLKIGNGQMFLGNVPVGTLKPLF